MVKCGSCGKDYNEYEASDAFEFDEGIEYECPYCGIDTYVLRVDK